LLRFEFQLAGFVSDHQNIHTSSSPSQNWQWSEDVTLQNKKKPLRPIDHAVANKNRRRMAKSRISSERSDWPSASGMGHFKRRAAYEVEQTRGGRSQATQPDDEGMQFLGRYFSDEGAYAKQRVRTNKGPTRAPASVVLPCATAQSSASIFQPN
jgi:hypothetical protein